MFNLCILPKDKNHFAGLDLITQLRKLRQPQKILLVERQCKVFSRLKSQGNLKRYRKFLHHFALLKDSSIRCFPTTPKAIHYSQSLYHSPGMVVTAQMPYIPVMWVCSPGLPQTSAKSPPFSRTYPISQLLSPKTGIMT